MNARAILLIVFLCLAFTCQKGQCQTFPVPTKTYLDDVGGILQRTGNTVHLDAVSVTALAATNAPCPNCVLLVAEDGTNAYWKTLFPPPVANFTAGPISGAAPLTVIFTNTSTGTITRDAWTFGDGGTSNTTAGVVNYTYAAAGTNTVSLSATGPGGTSINTQSNLIVVSDPGIGYAMQFDGENYIAISNDDAFYSQTNLTLECWFYLNSYNTIISTLVDFDNTVAGYYLAVQDWDSSHVINLGVDGFGACSGVTAVTTGVWHHVAAIYNAGSGWQNWPEASPKTPAFTS